MEDLLGSVKDIVSFVDDSNSILGGAGLTALSLAGAIPRAGPVRALTLGWRSFFKSTRPLSVRISEVQALKDSLLSMERGNYIAVIGGKGNGKSCLVDTALHRQCGVVKISTQSGADKKRIINEALRGVTGIELSFLNPRGSARHSLLFYNFFFKHPPIVVIRVPERLRGQPYADLPSAVRALADDYGLRVVVDGSANSIPHELLTTKRQTVIRVEPMSRDQIESIAEFEGLIDFLRAHRLDDAVWKVLGGSPAHYLKLEEVMNMMISIQSNGNNGALIVERVKNHLQSTLLDAFNDVLDSSSNTKQIIKVLREKKVIKISKAELKELGFLLEYSDKVLREVKTLKGWYIEPAASAVSLIISENIRDDAGVCELTEQLFNNEASEKLK